MRSLVILSAVMFCALFGRLVYLRGHAQEALASKGWDVETFYQYPPSDTVNEWAIETVSDGKNRMEYTVVPSVLNATFEEAGQILIRSGLLTEAQGNLQGHVTEQVPSPNTRVRRGTSVRVQLR